MPDESIHDDSTKFEEIEENLIHRSTAVDATEFSAKETPADHTSDRSRQQLIENYRSLLRTRVIYYPVAYRFLRELGRGRQGTVFLGLRQGARGCVTRHAIKIFDPSIYANAEKYWTDMGRIAFQISQLQSVTSPDLVSREAYEESNGIGYIQMEAVDGVDIAYLLSQRHLEKVRKRSTSHEWSRFTDAIFRFNGNTMSIQPGIAIYILRRILRALETLHDNGFVHSDIKPANVMVDQLGYVKLIDYGRAVQINERVSILLGTPYYMAPEMHRRESAKSQSDLYSVGILGIEMLSGHQLPDARNEAELLDMKMHLPDRLHELLPQHVKENAHLTDLIRGLIHPDPAERASLLGGTRDVEQSLGTVHRDMVRMDVDADYGRELRDYLAKLKNPETKQIEK